VYEGPQVLVRSAGSPKFPTNVRSYRELWKLENRPITRESVSRRKGECKAWRLVSCVVGLSEVGGSLPALLEGGICGGRY